MPENEETDRFSVRKSPLPIGTDKHCFMPFLTAIFTAKKGVRS